MWLSLARLSLCLFSLCRLFVPSLPSPAPTSLHFFSSFSLPCDIPSCLLLPPSLFLLFIYRKDNIPHSHTHIHSLNNSIHTSFSILLSFYLPHLVDLVLFLLYSFIVTHSKYHQTGKTAAHTSTHTLVYTHTQSTLNRYLLLSIEEWDKQTRRLARASTG